MIELAIPGERLAALCRCCRVRELSVLGSVARGDARPDNEIDSRVDSEPSARIRLTARASLAQVPAALLGHNVDMVPRDGLKPRIRKQGFREAEVLLAA